MWLLETESIDDLGMIGDGLTTDAASSGQDVDDSGRNSGFVTEFRELQGGQWANLESGCRERFKPITLAKKF